MITATITRIPVTKKGGKHFFDVYIPDDAVQAFGVEADISGSNIPAFIAAQLPEVNTAGMITLQIPGKAGLCYGAPVMFRDDVTEELMSLFNSVHSELVPLFTSPYYRRDYDSLLLARAVGGHVLHGCYEDAVGKLVDGDINYIVTLTIWTQI